jgi:hypothetical protein
MRRGEEGYGSLTATRVARAAKAAARVARAASVVKGDSGSLVILVLSLFFLLLMSSLAVVDISDNFLAKRQLIEIGEVAITRAAHQISLSRYYAGNILMDTSGGDGAQFRIPIDCQKAYGSFFDEIATSSLRANPITITSWSCSGDEVTGTLTTEIPILLRLPMGMGSASTVISSTVGATSIIGGARG